MGLRMYRDPDEVETKQPTIKTDPTAPARSAIRRQRTVRYSPNTHTSSFPTISSSTRRPGSSHGRTRIPSGRRSLLEDIRRREGAPSNTSEVLDLEAALRENSSVRAADIAHNEASQRSRLESGRALLRDALSYERPSERMRISRDTSVPEAPEARRRSGNTTAPRRDHWPTPPYSSGESSANSPVHRSTPPLGTASFTPRFAPAHRLSNEADDQITGGQTLATRQDSLGLLAERLPTLREALTNDEDRAFVNTLASEIDAMRTRRSEHLTHDYVREEADYLRQVGTRLNLLAVNSVGETGASGVDDLPPLRRMDSQYEVRPVAARREFRRGQRARAGQDVLDGLGDRQRSFSPDDDTWETMLTTITPDERHPSAHSSFTTATASASSLSSNSATSSYGTRVTAPSTSTEIEACPAESSESDEDYVLDVIEENDSFRIRSRETMNLLRQSEGHLARIENLNRRLDQHRAYDESLARHRRAVAREEELSRLESSVQRLERQVAEERSAAGRQRPEERL